jgi:cysteine desulfurase
MLPFFNQQFGNPHSRHHIYGWAAEDAVEAARRQVAALIGARPREITFTSGATEANNLAIKGATGLDSTRNEIVTCVTEHKCVLEACRRLENDGRRVAYLPVGAGGLVDLAALAAAVSEKTALVSIMAVNNEIGVIQPLAEIGRLCRARGALFHTDAAQAAGKIALDVEAMNIDLLSLSGHKLYGPMGIGALYVRRKPGLRLQPLFDGGGQERGLRSGTLPLPLCVGLGAACQIAAAEMTAEGKRLQALRDTLLAELRRRLPDIRLNGDVNARAAGNLNISFPGIDAEDLMMEVKEVAVSSGSACSSASIEPSYVLHALGLSDEIARASLRISVGRFTTAEEINRAAALLADGVVRLRESSRSQAF